MDDNETHDVEDRLKEESAGRQSEEERVRVPWGVILLALWGVAVVIFSVQNAEDTIVEFLGWSFNMPVALLVLVTALVTLVLTGLGFVYYRRRRRKEAKRLRKQGQSGD
ncbi:MAG TPA: lipopolysaccharide assembly protein LapA domain-containing protein [Acidimicrobiia bacterium]|nr:lipopolysaccharide assembly protein LapA domain-containing protein [Acidimicrobiia bacterium]